MCQKYKNKLNVTWNDIINNKCKEQIVHSRFNPLFFHISYIRENCQNIRVLERENRAERYQGYTQNWQVKNKLQRNDENERQKKNDEQIHKTLHRHLKSNSFPTVNWIVWGFLDLHIQNQQAHVQKYTYTCMTMYSNVCAVHFKHTQPSPETMDRILASIYRQCIGDAIGLLTEFLSKDEAKMVNIVLAF